MTEYDRELQTGTGEYEKAANDREGGSFAALFDGVHQMTLDYVRGMREMARRNPTPFIAVLAGVVVATVLLVVRGRDRS